MPCTACTACDAWHHTDGRQASQAPMPGFWEWTKCVRRDWALRDLLAVKYIPAAITMIVPATGVGTLGAKLTACKQACSIGTRAGFHACHAPAPAAVLEGLSPYAKRPHFSAVTTSYHACQPLQACPSGRTARAWRRSASMAQRTRCTGGSVAETAAAAEPMAAAVAAPGPHLKSVTSWSHCWAM